MSSAALLLLPPFRFSHVEAGLYRSGYPQPRNYPFLRQVRSTCPR